LCLPLALVSSEAYACAFRLTPVPLALVSFFFVAKISHKKQKNK